MKTRFLLFAVAVMLLMFGCESQNSRLYKTVEKTDANGYSYYEVSNDPLKARVYTLQNGLTVMLSPNADEPRVTCLVGVRAGSTSDPEETTGLAHYFEHMMFKGTSKLGTVNWPEEQKLIEQIEALYEQHLATDELSEKMKIYRQIDSLSQEAAKYMATNEYDMLMSSIGAKNTNAGTSYDLTVYINDVPVNELERWALIESERFNGIVLRLFHTELETVYEEFNMYQDRDSERSFATMMKALFPNHPYGRDVIGYPEHIKNPSMINIQEFFKTYYVPNNMAIALSGDINFEETIKLIDKYFGPLEQKELPVRDLPVETPMTEVATREVVGPESENVTMAWRFDGIGSTDQLHVELIDMILSNSQAGLIDLNLVQQQKVLSATSSQYTLKDYGIHMLMAAPLESQSLEELEQLLMAEIEKVKQGDFDEWLIDAVRNDLKLRKIRQQERNMGRAYEMFGNFIDGLTRKDALEYMAKLDQINKADLVKFANEKYLNNYVVVYKRQGDNSQLVKVDKPEITPVPVNRNLQSDFAKSFQAMQSPDLTPVFVDFDQQITQAQLAEGCNLYYIKNESNDLFALRYIVDMGKWHSLEFELAVGYLRFIGTNLYNAPELQQELYRYGLEFNVSTDNERSYVTIRGLNSSFEKGVEILEHILANAQADKQAYTDYVNRILKDRQDQKADQSTILWQAMLNYGSYGANNPHKYMLSEAELRAIDPQNLTQLIKQIAQYEHNVFYYGPESFNVVKAKMENSHTLPDQLKKVDEAMPFAQAINEKPKVYLVDFDINQANILLVASVTPFEKSLIAPAKVYNEFYGSGLSSVVFQEIRESKALAYSAFSAFRVARKPNRLNELVGYLSTQADKLPIATQTLVELMNNLPEADDQFNMAKESIIKIINSERITKEQIFWTWQTNKDRGIDYDIRKDEYELAKTMTMEEFSQFFDQQIKGHQYTYLILGKKSNFDMNALNKLGNVEPLSLEELFGY